MNREINAAVVNISGRQRMLSQRIAFLALRLVHASHASTREALRQELLGQIDLMARSHQGLLQGDADLNLPGYLSDTVRALYFEAPLQLNEQVCQYLQAARQLCQLEDAALQPDCPQLQAIVQAAAGPLLIALDTVVKQYEQESDDQQRAFDAEQARLYAQSQAATTSAQTQAQKLKQALETLQATQTQLIQTEKMSSLGQLVAGIAHEINNPISFIYGNVNHASQYIQDLLRLIRTYQTCYPAPAPAVQICADEIDLEFLQVDLPKLLTSIRIGSERIYQIVLSLRNFSRLDEAEMKPVEIHEGIESTLLILQHRLKEAPDEPEIQVIRDYDDLPLVECYPSQLNQVFMNLLSNAIDALRAIGTHSVQRDTASAPIEPWRPTLWIQTALVERYIQIRIRDNGPGIPEAIRSRLFDPFFTTKPVGQGTGLGLSISHQIVVERHQGQLHCDSQLGEGTTFEVNIPLHSRLSCPIEEGRRSPPMTIADLAQSHFHQGHE